jgi:circadian clock protein KaiC
MSKSTLALKFAVSAAEKGEKSLLFIFDETVGTLVSRASQLGMDVASHIEKGLMVIEQVDPAEISPYRHKQAVCLPGFWKKYWRACLQFPWRLQRGSSSFLTRWGILF